MSIREIQRQVHSSPSEMDNVTYLYEARRLKRAQEMRMDEFSRHELRESTLLNRSPLQGVAGKNELCEWFWRTSRCRISSPRKIIRSLRHDTWNQLGTSGNVFDSPRAVIDSSSTPYQGMLHSWNQSATGVNAVRERTEKPVARGEERNRETIPMPRFASRPSFSPAQGANPQNYMADQSRLQISELPFDQLLTLSTFSCWKIRFRSEFLFQISSEAMLWNKAVEVVDSVDDLISSRSTHG